MFENAKQYNAEGSEVYLDAEDLQVIGLNAISRFSGTDVGSTFD